MSRLKTPLYLLLLPVFFVLHGFTYNYDFVPVKDALLLILVYSSAAILITGLAWLFYRNVLKAALASFILLGFHLFFGYGRSILHMGFPDSFLSEYPFILTASVVLLAAIIIGIKRIKKPLYRITSFLNMLLLLLLLIDMAWLFTTIKRPTSVTIQGLTNCDSCKKPDVYFIILDEYTGNAALKDKFNFDNTAFTNELAKRGFYVAGHSTSNYNSTPYSIASILNMDYLEVSPSIENAELNYCYRRIRNNAVLQFMADNHYTIYNYSVFDLDQQPTLSPDYFLPRGTYLVTAPTFLTRIKNDLFTKKNLIYRDKVFEDNLQSIETFMTLTRKVAGTTSTTPKFVYTHLLMPHSPYYYDSAGKAMPVNELPCDSLRNPVQYVSYLQYCNKRMLALTDDIIAHSPNPPLIILAGDHGFRDYPDKDYQAEFINLQAVLLPSRNYKEFYNDMSSVNLFRVVLNTEFRQQLPLLKDSVIHLQE
jgi:hypothetical protein